jgi:hypothetical protein
MYEQETSKCSRSASRTYDTCSRSRCSQGKSTLTWPALAAGAGPVQEEEQQRVQVQVQEQVQQ